MMKTKKKSVFFSEVLLTVVILLFCSCAGTDPTEDCLKGTLKLNIVMPSNVKSEQSVKDFSEDSITVGIYKKDSKKALLSYEGISNVPESIELSEGTYLVKAFSTYYPEAAFENPCYYGESEFFNIVSEESTSVNFSCFICNIPIKITYTENTKTSFDSFTTTIFDDEDSLIYNKGEERAGYFKPNSLTIKTYLTYGSKTKTITKEIKTPISGTTYTINIDTKVPGDVSVTITFNNNTENLTFYLTDDGFVEKSNYSKGAFLITEIMCNPEKIGDTKGEWVEIYNNTSEEHNIKGFVLKRSATDFIQITDNLIIPSMGYAVLANSSDAGSGEEIDYVYGTGLLLTNTDLYLDLATGGTDGTDGFTISSIDMNGFKKNDEGKSMQLNLANINTTEIIDTTAAKSSDNWSNSTVTFSTGDYGTPGKENTVVEL